MGFGYRRVRFWSLGARGLIIWNWVWRKGVFSPKGRGKFPHLIKFSPPKNVGKNSPLWSRGFLTHPKSPPFFHLGDTRGGFLKALKNRCPILGRGV